MANIPFEIETPSNSFASQTPNNRQTQTTTKIWSVSGLTRHIRLALENQFRSLIVEGELSNFKRSVPGHLYFQLKDKQAQIRGIMFRQAARMLKFEPTDGLEVVVKGHLAVYEPRGEYQIQVISMEPKGVGSLQLAYEQLKEKLEKEGLFAKEHKQKIPLLPKKIGIVTSPTGAVIHDMLNVHSRRCPTVPLLLFPANVQGDQAVPSLVEGIEYFNELKKHQDIDVLIIGRGGGSIEDLWAFNDEQLARSIFKSRIPIISAVGHETDFTIADFVSDLRAPTPSAAMELAVPKLQDLLATLDYHHQRLEAGINRYLQSKQEFISSMSQRLRSPEFIIHQHIQRLDDLSSRLTLQYDLNYQELKHHWKELLNQLISFNPKQSIQTHRSQLEWLLEKLHRNLEAQISQKQNTLVQKMTMLDSLSPLSVMKRGYGVVTNSSQTPIYSIASIEIGDRVNVQLQDGTFEAIVDQKMRS